MNLGFRFRRRWHRLVSPHTRHLLTAVRRIQEEFRPSVRLMGPYLCPAIVAGVYMAYPHRPPWWRDLLVRRIRRRLAHLHGEPFRPFPSKWLPSYVDDPQKARVARRHLLDLLEVELEHQLAREAWR